jgi:ferritin-like metal-binding protein YciE
MKKSKLISLILIIFTLSNLIFAQTSPTESKEEKEKAQKESDKKAFALLEQVVGETPLLKFSDNRALVLASAGDLMWQRDEKRARQLFRQAADEIIQTNNMPKDDSGMPGIIGIFQNASPRKQILTNIAKHDAELALELLYATRPAIVAQALASNPQPIVAAAGQKTQRTAASMMEDSQNKFLADDELRLEQSFSAQAADKDPAKAAKLLRESIAKNGVTNSVFQILNKINSKDNKLAMELTNEIGKKLLDSDFTKKDSERNVTTSFLQQFYLNSAKPAAKPDAAKPLKIEDKLAKDLANKIADYLIQADEKKGMSIYYQFRQIVPVLDKIIPERSQAIKQKQAAIKKALPTDFAMFDDDIFDGSNASPEKMISGASKMPSQIRGQMYKSAIDQASREGDIEKARTSLNQAPEGKDRDDALAYLDSKVAESKIKDGKIDEARKIIDQLSSTKEKVERLVQIAIGFQAKDTKEDKEAAAQLMEEAKRLIDSTPQDEDAINDYFRVASGYAYVEPNIAFSMLDAFASQASEIVTAAALLAKYDKRNQSFKNGEMILTRGLPRVGNSIFQYGKELNLLAVADIDRLRSMTDRFQRDDARLLLKLYIVQAYFGKKIGIDGSAGGIGSGVGNMVFTMSN